LKCDRRLHIVRVSQNLSGRKTVQALLGLPVSRQLDIARLRPGKLTRRQRFETLADARARRDAELERFEQIAELTDVADRLLGCTAESRCAGVSCPICGARFRRWLTGQALRQQQDLDLLVITIALEVVPSKKLRSVDLRTLKRRAAQRIRRAAPSAKFVLGGLEAEYMQDDDSFLIHAHLLVPPLPRVELTALRSAFADIDVTRAVKVQPLRDPAAQLSYMLKFTTFYRPGSQKGSRRPTAIPLPDHALKRLTLWRARHEFLDFVFMMGFRRIGGDLVRFDGKKAK
jgi:hypothetical protein